MASNEKEVTTRVCSCVMDNGGCDSFGFGLARLDTTDCSKGGTGGQVQQAHQAKDAWIVGNLILVA